MSIAHWLILTDEILIKVQIQHSFLYNIAYGISYYFLPVLFGFSLYGNRH